MSSVTDAVTTVCLGVTCERREDAEHEVGTRWQKQLAGSELVPASLSFLSFMPAHHSLLLPSCPA